LVVKTALSFEFASIAQEELMLKKLEIVSSAVNGRVMENYSEFVEGISLVSELQTNLTVR
jgi:hypothetical protein